MLSINEIVEILFVPGKFFRNPKRGNEGFVRILFRITPSILLFIAINAYVMTIIIPVTTLAELLADYVITAFVSIIIFWTLAIQLRFFGLSVFHTYQAFMYGFVSFLMVGGLSGAIGMLWTLYSTYWGLVVLHGIKKSNALSSMIIPALIILLWQVFLSENGLAILASLY